MLRVICSLLNSHLFSEGAACPAAGYCDSEESKWVLSLKPMLDAFWRLYENYKNLRKKGLPNRGVLDIWV